MEQHEAMEMALWNYIDNLCSDAERQHVEQMLAEDTQWQEHYHELLEIHQSITGMEAEMPPMRFSKNVMEAIATTHIAPATHKYVNVRIINAIAIFFIAGLLAMLGYAFANARPDDSSTIPHFKAPDWHFNLHFDSSSVTILIAVNVILGLVLLDKMLHKKRKQQTS